MMQRGRGTLAVRPSANPFFQTTSAAIGEDFYTEKTYSAPANPRSERQPKLEDEFDFKFQYVCASSEIGPFDQEAKSLGVEPKRAASAEEEEAAVPKPMTGTERASKLLSRYEHNPKPEHVMYKTTSNVYGNQRPTVATFTADRLARSQQFSNGFNGIKYRDQGLNTAVNRSAVHNSLDML